MPPAPAPASSQGGYSLQSTHCRTTSSVIAIRYIHPYYTGHVGNCQEKFPAVWFVQNPQILDKPAFPLPCSVYDGRISERSVSSRMP